MKSLQKLLEEFAALDYNKDGVLNLQEFQNYLQIPSQSISENLFDVFDLDRDNAIDFKEFVLGVVLLDSQIPTTEKLQVAFALFTEGERVEISFDQFQKVMKQLLLITFRESKNVSIESVFQEIDVNNDGFISCGRNFIIFFIFFCSQELKMISSNTLKQTPVFASILDR